jgi:hypothetical protein
VIPILILAVAAKYAAQIVTHPKNSVPEADRLAKVADIFALGTLALALVAGLIALQAYAAATGQPKLQLRVRIAEQRNNEPIFEFDDVQNRLYARAQPNEIIAHIWIRNRSSFSAKNPAVIVRLSSMARDWTTASPSLGWEQIEFKESGDVRDMQWDGGDTFSIHGDSVRRLPDLSLNGLYFDKGNNKPVIQFELLAEGYRRSVQIAVVFLKESMHEKYLKETKKSKEWI